MYSAYMPHHTPGAFPALILLATPDYISKTVGGWVLMSASRMAASISTTRTSEGCVVSSLEGCSYALSTVTLQTPGQTAGFHR